MLRLRGRQMSMTASFAVLAIYRLRPAIHYGANLHLINNLPEKPYLCPPNFR